MNFWLSNKLMMNKADAAGGGPSKTPPATPPVDDKKVDPPTPPNDPPVKADGDKPVESKLDFYGKEPGKAPEKKPDEKKDASEKSEEVEPGTGYGAEPPKVEDPPKDPPKDPPTPPVPTDLDKKLEGLNEGFAKIVKEQATDLGLEGEKLDKFIALKKTEQAAAVKWQQDQQAEMKRQENAKHAAWDKELREDPTFGGQNFNINRTRAEKILDEYGGEFKKELTTNKVMVRPSVMRMLARIADDVWPDRKELNGDPPGAENDKNEEKKSSPLDFYQQ